MSNIYKIDQISWALLFMIVGSSLALHPSTNYHSPYSYSYSVQDEYTGNHFGASEVKNGDNVVGSYEVNLPDGRKQTVKYTADEYSGYVAEVNYDGVSYSGGQPHVVNYASGQPQVYHSGPISNNRKTRQNELQDFVVYDPKSFIF